MRSALPLLVLALGARADARPVEAVQGDRATASAELRDLDRRAASLDDQLGLRQRMLRRRVRALYKLAQGGTIRLVAAAGDPAELEQRLGAAERVVARDLQELSALGEELDELGRDRTRRAEELGKSALLEEAHTLAMSEAPTGLERRRGQLGRPVPGPITVGMAHVRLDEAHAGSTLELPRRGVELIANSGDNVRAVAPGTVRWTGALEGQGRTVIVDHGDRYLSVTGRLAEFRVEPGDVVAEGTLLGTAAGPTVSFELSEGRTSLDPGRWMHPPGTLPVMGAAPARAATPSR